MYAGYGIWISTNLSLTLYYNIGPFLVYIGPDISGKYILEIQEYLYQNKKNKFFIYIADFADLFIYSILYLEKKEKYWCFIEG